MYTYKLKYRSGQIPGNPHEEALITRNIKPYVDGNLERNEDAYRVRIKFTGKITLMNRPGINDFDLFKEIESLNWAKKCFIEIWEGLEKRFEGYFYPFNCTVDNDSCKVEISELQPIDEYTGMDEIKDIKYNLIKEVPPTEFFNVDEPVRMEYYVSETNYTNFETDNNSNCGKPFTSTGGGILNFIFGMPYFVSANESPQGHPFYNAFYAISSWSIYNDTSVFPYGVVNDPFRDSLLAMARIVKDEIIINNYVSVNRYDITVRTTWALEVAITANNPETNAPQVPSGSGWVFVEEFTYNNKYHSKYVRQPYFLNQTYEYEVTDQACSQFFTYSLKNPYSNDPVNSVRLYWGMTLTNVLAKFAQKAGLAVNYQSHFFQDAINPVTGNPNTYYSLHSCKDVKGRIPPLPTIADPPQTLMELSFTELMSNLQTFFPIEWIIENNTLIIEHIDYFENGRSYVQNINNTYDITGLENKAIGKKQIVRTNNYTYNLPEIFTTERWENAQFLSEEFEPRTIVYDLNFQEKNEKSRISQFITDINGIFVDPTQFSDDSIVFLSYKPLVDVAPVMYNCETEQDYLSGIAVGNGHLTFANLITNYWMTFRVLKRALFEGTLIFFNSETKKKIQNVLITDCNCVYLQTNNLIKTNLGLGRIISSRHNLLQKTTELTLKVGYEN